MNKIEDLFIKPHKEITSDILTVALTIKRKCFKDTSLYKTFWANEMNSESVELTLTRQFQEWNKILKTE